MGDDHGEALLLKVDIAYIQDTIIDIKCGLSHSLFLTATGSCFSFGHDGYGQCGFNKLKRNNTHCTILKPRKLFNNNIIKISCGKYCSLLVNDKNQLISFGSNHFGQLGLYDEAHKKCIYHPTVNEYFNM